MTHASAAPPTFVAFDQQFQAWATARPDALALTDGQQSISYSDLHIRINAASAALAVAGVRSGHVVAIAAANSMDYVISFLALLRLGAGAALLPVSAGPAAVRAMAIDSGAALILVDATGAAVLPAVGDDALPTAIDVADITAAANAPVQNHQYSAAEPSATFNIIYSSGTTGTPKGIVHSHRMRWLQFRDTPLLGYGPGSVCIASTPLYSNTTLVGMLPALMLGGAVVLMQKFETAHFLALSARFRVTHAMLVPAQIRRILADPGFDQTDLSAFQLKISTSAPLSADLKREMLERWPGGLIEFYGMTEGGGTCVLIAHMFPNKLHTVGQPIQGHDIRIIDSEDKQLLQGDVGEIVSYSDVLMGGYRNLPDQSDAAIWYSEDGRPFMRTGDIGRFDEDGFLIILDRRKDMIISGGFNIYPSDIEAIIAQHPEILEVAVVGAASARWGETPVAYVVPQKNITLDPHTLADWVNARVGRNQRIARVEPIAELPRNALGKVLKRDLRAKFDADFGALP